MMSRSRLLLAFALMTALGTFGCAHCDTCDDFPAPCVGPNCGGGAGYAAPGPVQYGGPTASPTGMNVPAAAPVPPPVTETSDIAPAPAGSNTDAAPGVDSALPTPSVRPEGDGPPTPPTPSLPPAPPQ